MDFHHLSLLTVFTGFMAFDCSVIRKYYYVNKSLTWKESKAYCRSKYLDLASARSKEDLNLLYQVAGTPIRKGWIGLHHLRFNWSWTMEDNHLYKDSTFLKKWTSTTPYGTARRCAFFQSGLWAHGSCAEELHFVCQNSEFKYFLVQRKMDWTRALEYCRRNYTDLANFRSDSDKTALHGLAGDQAVWIGLHNMWRWADGSVFSLYPHGLPKASLSEDSKDAHRCAILNDSLVYDNCLNTKPFYCHKDFIEKKKLTVRITIKSPYNIEDNPILQGVILQQIHHKLSEQDPEQNFTVTWKQPSFQKEERIEEDEI